ncbi:calcium-binding protein [Amycolatopsis sp. MtRt-6]|uniref:calcium-binding protein n=1 Tax=Amycolatopsis sp. MtRt-6 TaxID=2792782 RepID=UPI001A8CC482|nr:calcium-binding protein [Amycolatopsis sp. MtRt-6]
MGSRRWLGLTTAFALSLGGIVVTAAPARAADPGVTTLVNALAAPANSFAAWSKGLGTLGQLAKALPAVQTSPGAALGFDTLAQEAFHTGTKKLADAVDDADLDIDQPISLSADRTGTLKTTLTSVGEDKRLDLTLTVSRVLQDQALSVPLPIGGGTNAPQSAFSSTGGVRLTVSTTMKLSLIWDKAHDKAYFVNDGTTPAFTVDAEAGFPDANAVKAVKAAVGILGVRLADDSSLDLKAHFAATINDPDNDGKLAFTNFDGTAGELAQNGSLAGLVSFGFASPAGSLTGSLHLAAAPASSFSLELPAVDAKIGIQWPDIATGTPQIVPEGIDTVGPFLNMTPRDLATGLAQLATTLTSIQRAKWGDAANPVGNLDLPFLKGTLADAIQLNESIKKFLQDNTKTAADPAQAGEPLFVSLQEMLDKLNTAANLPGGGKIGVSDVHFPPGTTKLDFKITISRQAPTTAVDLNAAAAAASGPAGSPGKTTYTQTTLKDENQKWKPGEFAGRHVVAGAAGATVENNNENTLFLQAPGWTPVVPVANAPYTISGMQGDVGVVQLGNDLKTGGRGVGEANAVNATAKVKPSYDAAVTLVLDLRNPTVHNPPIEQKNPDGSTILVGATPTGPDRVLLRTAGAPSLFTADFPMDADVDIFANAGFLQVELKGAAHVCHPDAGADCGGTPDADDHMLQVKLKDQGDLTFGAVVDKLLHDPGALLDFQVSVRGAGGVDASAPGTGDFLKGATAHAGFTWNDLTKLTGSDGPQFSTSDLSELANFDFDPANPKALFSIVLKTLQTLNASISDASPAGAAVFGTKIPLVGRSLRDLLRADEAGSGPKVTYGANSVKDTARSVEKGNAFPQTLIGRTVVAGTQVGIVGSVTADTLVLAGPWASQPSPSTAYVIRSELDDVISMLEAAPSDNLQRLVQTINERFKGSAPVQFEYADLAGTPSLIIRLDWKRAYHTSTPVQFDFSLPAGTQRVAGVQGEGSVSLGVGGEVKMGLVVPLQPGSGPADANALRILDDSKIGVQLDAAVENATIATTLGPLTVSLGNPKSADKATAKASYSLDLAKSGGTGTPVTFSEFVGAVGPSVNAASTAVNCGLDGSTPLGLCAKLPLYISEDGGATYGKVITDDTKANDFALRLPKSTTPDDYFDLGGAAIDGHPRLETPDPTLLGQELAKRLIDFGRLDGLDSYLNLVEQALNTASFGGKLPLLGDDLQQGADFIGKLRAAIHTALDQLPADGHFTDMAAVRGWVNDQLGAKLAAAGLNPDTVTVDTVCKTRLGTVGVPTVALHEGATAADKTYRYVIASYATINGEKKQAKASDPGSITTGPATLSATDSLDISWEPVDSASGYMVFREEGGVFKLIADVTGTKTTDTGAAAIGGAPENPAENPQPHDCAYNDLDAVTISLNVSQGDFSGDLLNCAGLPAGHECLKKSVPLDLGIPGFSLKADGGAGPEVQLGWRLHLAMGISRSEGFFVITKDSAQPEFAVGLNVTLPQKINAQLAFINITAENCTKDLSADDCNAAAAPPANAVLPLFGGAFKIDLIAPDDPTNGRLHLTDLQNAGLDRLADVKLHASADINWLLKARPGDDAGFPGIQANFRLHWAWNNVKPGTNSADGGNSPLTLAFDKVAIDSGEIFGKILGPIVNKVKQVTGPLDPVIKTLYAPIPVLSDLSHLAGGGDVTLVSLGKAFSTIAGGPDLKFVDTIAGIITFINNFPTCTTTCLIPLGSFELGGQKALDTTATPDNTESLISTKKDAGGGTTFAPLLDTINGKNSNPNSVNPMTTQASAAGFSFPVFEKPASLFNVLLGGDVDLVKFDSGPLRLGFDWRQQFGPVYAPPPVVITLHGSASVTLRIVAGFDTYGIRKAFEAARAGTLDLGTVGNAFLQSLFFYTTENGKPIPVVTFTGEIAAGAAVTAVIITVGIEGGLGLTVSFLWNDPNHDGKFRITEFLQTALNNPICLFTVSGRLYVFLKLYVTVGFGPFSVSFSFTIVDVTLLDFTATPNCTPPPPKLGGLSGDGKTLVVYAAALGHTAQRGGGAGDPYESNNQEKDTVKITSLHDYANPANPAFTGVAVDMLGIRREFRNPNIERVIVDGRGYAKPMSVTFIGDAKADTTKTGPPPPTAQFDRDAVVFGGTKNDQIKTGIGHSWVDGGAGDDVIVTGDRTVLAANKTSYVRDDAKARVAGGPGVDSITVGNGVDIVAGDSSLGAPPVTSIGLKELKNDGRDSGDPLTDGTGGPSVSVPNWALLPDPAGGTGTGDAGDTIKVGLAKSTAFGNGGDDTLGVSADDPLKDVPTYPQALFVSQGATLVGGDGSDRFAGGTGPDKIYPAAQVDPGIDGYGSDDANTSGGPEGGPINTIDTGSGNDTVYGGKGQDRVTGHSTKDQHDDFRGGGGNDILFGGFGPDTLYGGPDDDYVIAEPSTLDFPNPGKTDGFGPFYVVTHTPLPQGVTPSPKTLVGGLGFDHVIGGDGGADVYGDKQTTPCKAGTPIPSTPVDESVNDPLDGNDRIIGGAGVENVRAGGGDDNVDAEAANDLVCGEKGKDALHGGRDADQVWGGSDDDAVHGDAGADMLYGNDGADTMFGGDDPDTIEGNNGTDWVSGGLAGDTIVGGTRAAGQPDDGDKLFGDTGPDTIIGDNGDPLVPGGPVFDLASADPALGGDDTISGGFDNDALFGGLENDTVFGGKDPDRIEGNPGADTLNGETGADDIIGGSHQTPGDPAVKNAAGYPDAGDTISGGDADDVITGDNATITGTGGGDTGDPVTRGRGLSAGRHVVLFDLGYTPVAGTSGGDSIFGGEATDVIYAQGGTDTVHGDAGDDYGEGGQDADKLFGESGQDDLVGGSSYVESGTGQGTAGQLDTGDTISGGDDADLITGDNALLTRDAGIPKSPITQGRFDTDAQGAAPMVQRSIQLYDLGDGPVPNTSGGDDITGDNGCDAILGQSGNDRLKGNADGDYAEGGPGRDWIEGNGGDDDLVGGSSVIFGTDTALTTQGQPDIGDVVFGGTGDDVVLGDNAITDRIAPPSPYLLRVGSTGTFETQRSLRLLDLSWSNGFLGAPARPVAGGDQLSGGGGVDVVFGQDGDDQISGGAHDDYAEGNGGHDTMFGDRTLAEAGIPITPPNPVWPGAASGDLGDVSAPNGQDDLLGGSSLAVFRDTADDVHGDGAADFVLGDGGTAVRDIVDQTGKPVALGDDLSKVSLPLTNRIYAKRYPATPPVGAAFVRHGAGGAPTRFCTTTQATCEALGASGGDNLWGDAGEDTLYGQDGNDLMHGDTGTTTAPGDGADDMYGELGDDRMWGTGGDDAMVGDRGGIVDVYQDGSNKFVIDNSQVPAIHYEGFLPGSVTRQVDLQHDVNGDAFAAPGNAPAMPHRGDLEGGTDRIRGGDDHDSIHGGFGDDLANGDSGGDIVFGDDGADVLWGGKGSTDPANPNDRGVNDSLVDYVLGGKGATSGPSVDPNTGALGSDIIDWRPRGTYGTPGQTTCTANPWPQTFGNGKNAVTVDPCTWFELTELHNADVADNQHHQGIDWIYGGWDRDVLQADVADNGPNQGDRLLDWGGAYNLYTHCNAAYGGYNDVRQFSPTHQDFLQRWAYSLGAGQAAGDVTTAGTSAFDELALVYQSDLQEHGSGPAFPTTPGHFDNPNACAP